MLVLFTSDEEKVKCYRQERNRPVPLDIQELPRMYQYRREEFSKKAPRLAEIREQHFGQFYS